MSSFGVIDLGTNTFHLLIAERGAGGHFIELYRERHFVKLAEEGIAEIGPAPFERGLATIRHYHDVLQRYGVARVRVVGTAALRTALNGLHFIQLAERVTNLRIELVSGREEAHLISRGVQLAVLPTDERYLIMDIGGGSVEFIIADSGRLYWAESFPVGVAVLYKNFHRHEPVTSKEIAAVQAFLSTELRPLADKLKEFPTHHLVGAAGTFDVLNDALSIDHPTSASGIIELTQFPAFYRRILAATRDERFAMPDIPHDRADMIVVALILVDFILRLAGVQRLTVSSYSMKEGILVEMMEKP